MDLKEFKKKISSLSNEDLSYVHGNNHGFENAYSEIKKQLSKAIKSLDKEHKVIISELDRRDKQNKIKSKRRKK